MFAYFILAVTEIKVGNSSVANSPSRIGSICAARPTKNISNFEKLKNFYNFVSCEHEQTFSMLIDKLNTAKFFLTYVKKK